ncbi:MAG: family N-acetyltransferase [Solirubrobacterales bacterium]|nr:family N-acetyltransferase [Solirubrobacterales bacterium]
MSRTRLAHGATAIRPTEVADVHELAALRRANREHTARWEPLRDETFYTPAGQQVELELDVQAWRSGAAYPFAVLDTTARDRLIGRVALSNVVRGAWQNANLGYWIDAASCGRGHATTAVGLILQFAFEQARLHRVQPAVIPRNIASICVVQKAGFRLEGRAERYLQIGGVWEDHDIFAVTAEEWRAKRPTM